MSIDYYKGIPGVTIVIDSSQDLFEALDALHTQVIDRLDEHEQAPLLNILRDAMDRVSALQQDG